MDDLDPVTRLKLALAMTTARHDLQVHLDRQAAAGVELESIAAQMVAGDEQAAARVAFLQTGLTHAEKSAISTSPKRIAFCRQDTSRKRLFGFLPVGWSSGSSKTCSLARRSSHIADSIDAIVSFEGRPVLSRSESENGSSNHESEPRLETTKPG
jgi:hypothetical protein